MNAYALLAIGPGGASMRVRLMTKIPPGWLSRSCGMRRRGPSRITSGFLHWEAAFPGVWYGWQDAFVRKAVSTPLSATRPGTASSSKRWSGSPSAFSRSMALAPTAAARRTGRYPCGCENEASPLMATEFDAAKERADTPRPVGPQGPSHYPLLGGGDINLYSLFVERAMRT